MQWRPYHIVGMFVLGILVHALGRTVSVVLVEAPLGLERATAQNKSDGAIQ